VTHSNDPNAATTTTTLPANWQSLPPHQKIALGLRQQAAAGQQQQQQHSGTPGVLPPNWQSLAQREAAYRRMRRRR
jgi:hypothetical protein